MTRHNYENAIAQIRERLLDVGDLVANAEVAMTEARPRAAMEFLDKAKTAIEGAMTTARWAATLPGPEE